MSVLTSAVLKPAPARDVTAPLDALLDGLRCGSVADSMDALVAHLAAVRRRSSPESWLEQMDAARAHPICEFIHRDPFAFRCYAKPRGYCADATALDYILRAREPEARCSEALGALHRYTTHGEAARALRFRRDFLAAEIDEAALRTSRPLRMFAAGAGYLRECDRMGDIARCGIGKLVAYDIDAENLEGARRDYPQLPVVTHHGSLRQLSEGKHLFGDMDLVYCAGLLESLPDAAAQALVRALFAMLAPGGVLVLTNFLAGLGEAAFLETYLDWRMTYRTQAQMVALVRDLPQDSVSSWSYGENAEATMGMAFATRL